MQTLGRSRFDVDTGMRPIMTNTTTPGKDARERCTPSERYEPCELYALARIVHEASYCERRSWRFFGSKIVLQKITCQTGGYLDTISP